MKKYSLLEAFNGLNNKIIRFDEASNSYRIAVKVRNKRTDGTCIYISRIMTEPLDHVLAGKVKMGLNYATTQELNSQGWQRLSDF